MAHLAQRVGNRQTTSLSPRLQHSVRLLQMSSLEFASTLRDTLGNNPFLEIEEGPSPQLSDDVWAVDASGAAAPGVERNGDSAHQGGGDQDAVGSGSDHDDYGSSALSMIDGDHSSEASASTAFGDEGGDHASDRDLWQRSDGGAGGEQGPRGSEVSALDLLPAEMPLNQHLHAQLRLLTVESRDRLLAGVVIESLDDDGYLRTPLVDLLSVAGLEPAPAMDEMQIALRRVQSLEPLGIGARDVAECLRLQLTSISCPALRSLAQVIIAEHLNALAAHDSAGLVRCLGETPARIDAACDLIRRMNPRPGWQLGASRVAFIVPDVLARKVRGRWLVQLNPAVVPRVRLNTVYEQLFRRDRTAQNAKLGADLQDARWTVNNVRQRFSTILEVASAIAERQQGFLDFGSMAMKPLGLREIAEAVGIHESTVSRATNNKYIATPGGVFELKYFFSRRMLSANGRACSGTAIRGLVKDIIDAECPRAPLSDAAITRELASQGLVVARRTVTKYRQTLKAEAVDRRRRCP